MRNLASAEFGILEWATNCMAEYFFLRKDWDSYGGVPLSPVAASVAAQFLLKLGRRGLSLDRFQEFRLLPLSDGGLHLEYYHEDTELEATFHPSGENDFYLESSSGELEGDLEDESLDALARLILV